MGLINMVLLMYSMNKLKMVLHILILGHILQVCNLFCNCQHGVLSENPILSNHAFEILQSLDNVPIEAAMMPANSNFHG